LANSFLPAAEFVFADWQIHFCQLAVIVFMKYKDLIESRRMMNTLGKSLRN